MAFPLQYITTFFPCLTLEPFVPLAHQTNEGGYSFAEDLLGSGLSVDPNVFNLERLEYAVGIAVLGGLEVLRKHA